MHGRKNIKFDCKGLRNTDCKCPGCDTSTIIDYNYFVKTLTNVTKIQYLQENIKEFNIWEK